MLVKFIQYTEQMSPSSKNITFDLLFLPSTCVYENSVQCRWKFHLKYFNLNRWHIDDIFDKRYKIYLKGVNFIKIIFA